MFEVYSENWGWFHRLLKSRQGWRAITAIALVAFSVADVLIGLFMLVFDSDSDIQIMIGNFDASVLLVMLAVVLPAVCVCIAFYLYLTWRRLQEPTGEEEISDDPRKPILYLRPFKSDKFLFYTPRVADSVNSSVAADWLRYAMGKSSSGTAEKFLVDLLKRTGPVVAIGRPGERVPPLGAARLYAGSNWKEIVLDFLNRACLVVLFAGTSAGFRWELEQVFDHRPFVPTILLLPYFKGVNSVRSLEKRRKRADQFRAVFQSVTGVPLPEGLEYCRIIYFQRPESPRVLYDEGEITERRLNMANPFLGSLAKIMEETHPGWSSHLLLPQPS